MRKASISEELEESFEGFAPETGDFEVVLHQLGDRRIAVSTVLQQATGLDTRTVREVFGLSLNDKSITPQKWTEGIPVYQALDQASADKIANVLEYVGATAEVRPFPSE